jgi:hypothetical protein
MNHSAQTLAGILRDPLVRQVMRADRVSLSEFAQLLQDASNRESRSRTTRSISLPERRGYENAV